MDKYKLQMKALKKHRSKVDNTPYLDESGVAYMMDCMDPGVPVRAEILKTGENHGRTTILEVACPLCGKPMQWNAAWEGFECAEHEKKVVYEVLKS